MASQPFTTCVGSSTSGGHVPCGCWFRRAAIRLAPSAIRAYGEATGLDRYPSSKLPSTGMAAESNGEATSVSS